MVDVEYDFLKFVKFADIGKWYVELFLFNDEMYSEYNLIPLKKIIRPIKNLIKQKDYDGSIPIIRKIVFKSGEMVLREKNETNMNLYMAKKGEIIVSKINFHQGATVLNTYGDVVCTTHYQPYAINKDIIYPKYLIRVLRSEVFMKIIQGIKAKGIKNEAGFDFIGAFKIPVPSTITEQKELVERHDNTLSQAKQYDNDAKKLEDSLNDVLFKELGITYESNKRNYNSKELLRHTAFTDITRWSVDYLLNQRNCDFIHTGKFKPILARKFIRKTQYGLSIKASKVNIGIPMLRMGNIQQSELNLEDLKYLPNEIEKNQDYLLNHGDLLFNRTNSKELVGKTAIFKENNQYVFASYLIRVIIDEKLADVEFINIMFASKIIRVQIDLISRQVLGQANMNAEEMKTLLFPLPPIDIQKNIADKLQLIIMKAKAARQKAVELRSQAKEEFEEAIFCEDNKLKN